MPLDERQEISAQVRWWYRHTAKQPSDTLEELAAECGRPVADIAEGIRVAGDLLDQVGAAIERGEITVDEIARGALEED